MDTPKVKRKSQGVRKATRNPEGYKCNLIKKAKVSGIEHTNHIDKIVPARKTGPNCSCSTKCVEKYNDEEKQSFIDKINSFESKDLQDTFLQGLLEISNVNRRRKRNPRIRKKKHVNRKTTYNYYVLAGDTMKAQVYAEAFASLYGIIYHNYIEERNTTSKLINVNIKQDLVLLEKYSSLQKLIRVTSFILRIKNRNKGALTCDELQYSLKLWIKKIQSIYFHDDLQRLNKEGVVRETSSIKRLYFFIDSEGILRVGGRLRNSQVEQKHQILLPSSSHLTDIIIMHDHNLNLHPGTELLLSILRNKYWIINGKHTIKRLTRKCITCYKQYASTMKQLMGNLPTVRINPSRPFTNTGVDYAGPFLIRPHLTRSRTTIKAYVALFICLCTKAVHLELVTSLSTEAFIATFRRFISRRGLPLNMYSDNGTNFVGANNKLNDLYTQLQSQQFQNEIHDKFSMQNITWHFIPPAAPHMGGLWESFIKITKKTFERVVGERILNFEEFYTILTQIEACINSRPLYALSSDPTDYSTLTPGHFLIGNSLLSLPESNDVHQVNYKTRWELQNQIVQSFWNTWSSSYITQLQLRSKWTVPQPNVKVGVLVLIHQANSSPLYWKMGRVIEVHQGQDNKVRVVTIKTTHLVIKRPITKIGLLPVT